MNSRHATYTDEDRVFGRYPRTPSYGYRDPVVQNMTLARKYETLDPILSDAYLEAARTAMIEDGYSETVANTVLTANQLRARAEQRRLRSWKRDAQTTVAAMAHGLVPDDLTH